MRKGFFIKSFYFFLGLTVIGIGFLGCSKQDPFSSQQDQNAKEPEIVESNVGPISLLSVDYNKIGPKVVEREPGLAKVGDAEVDSSLFYDEVFAEVDHDAKLEIKDKMNGDCKVEIKKHNLPHDMNVVFTWAEGSVYEGELYSPDFDNPVVFTEPAKIKLSYERADWIGVSLDQLGFYYKNSADVEWTKLEVKIEKDKIEGKIPGFGQFKIFQELPDGTLEEFFRLDANVFCTKRFIKKDKGGKLEVGNKGSGKSKIKFKKHDLPKDLNIEFKWAADGSVAGLVNNMQFGPHGTNFNNPVEVELSFRMADLSEINESTLAVYYYNEELGMWEYIGGEVDIKKQVITVLLEHFSRYAVAYGR